MKRLLILLLAGLLLHTASASVPPVSKSFSLRYLPQKNVLHHPQFIQQEWITNIFHIAYPSPEDSTGTDRHLKRKAKWVKWLGIGSLAILVIPVVNLIALPAAIVSLVLGSSVKRRTQDKNMLKDVSIGRILSLIAIGTIVLAVIIAILVALLVAAFFKAFIDIFVPILGGIR